MTRSPSLEVDRLLEAAWHAADAANWGLDALAANDVFTDDHHELDYISDTASRLHSIARTLTHYSDGRPVRTSITIERGHTFVMIWPAEPNWAVGDSVLYALNDGPRGEVTWRLTDAENDLTNDLTLDLGA